MERLTKIRQLSEALSRSAADIDRQRRSISRMCYRSFIVYHVANHFSVGSSRLKNIGNIAEEVAVVAHYPHCPTSSKIGSFLIDFIHDS